VEQLAGFRRRSWGPGQGQVGFACTPNVVVEADAVGLTHEGAITPARRLSDSSRKRYGRERMSREAQDHRVNAPSAAALT
jgi:hypothetical protein